MRYSNSISKLIEKTWDKVENMLQKKGFNTILLDSERALRKFIDETIPQNCIVGLGSSLTSSALKIKEILIERGNKIYYSWNGESYNRSLDTFEEHPRPDFFLTTADAITPEGRLINHEFSSRAVQKNKFPENIIAFSDFQSIDKPLNTTETGFVVFDEKPSATQFTVAVLPFSRAS